MSSYFGFSIHAILLSLRFEKLGLPAALALPGGVVIAPVLKLGNLIKRHGAGWKNYGESRDGRDRSLERLGRSSILSGPVKSWRRINFSRCEPPKCSPGNSAIRKTSTIRP